MDLIEGGARRGVEETAGAIVKYVFSVVRCVEQACKCSVNGVEPADAVGQQAVSGHDGVVICIYEFVAVALGGFGIVTRGKQFVVFGITVEIVEV